MVFSSIEFLFYFLPVVLGVYFLAVRFGSARLPNRVLLAASLLFYTWGSGVLVGLLLISTAVDYVLGRVVDEARERGDDRRRRLAVTGSVLVNLSLLGYFKYGGFLVEQLNELGLGTIAWEGAALPIGISFFTFQSMSYTIDISRGRCKHLSNPFDFALYVALFPQLIAGPIVRFHEIADELIDRSTRLEDFAQGSIRFGHGLAKKVIVADAVAEVANAAFSTDSGDLTFFAAWIGIAAYTVQIYFDFSGYSDMAIGLGRIFGFHFPENFNRPYSALSITDFWRRWHITLSNWFRDYVYIPLGGSKGSTTSTYLNLVAVFMLTGLWHGANWTFLVWGAYHGSLMLFERVTRTRYLEKAPYPVLSRVLTLFLVMVGWVIFRADSVAEAFSYLAAMFSPDGLGISAAVELAFDTRTQLVLALSTLVVFLPRDFVMGRVLETSPSRLVTYFRYALAGIAVPYSAMLIAAGTFSPFLYFQF
ncbi:MAG: MBOAT family protein [Acidobacteria bacterium]|nr:MBOAT family protein [Acidobacteriota bacterium]